MRVYLRSRRGGISVGPIGLLIIWPFYVLFLLAWLMWIVLVAAVYGIRVVIYSTVAFMAWRERRKEPDAREPFPSAPAGVTVAVDGLRWDADAAQARGLTGENLVRAAEAERRARRRPPTNDE